MRRQSAVVHDGTPETVEQDLAVMPGRVRRSLVRQLAEGERIVIRTRQHPAALWRYTLWPLGAALVWWFLVVEVQATSRLVDVVTWVVLVGAARLGWMEVERRYRWVVVTNKRILKHEGIVTRRLPMMRLTKVTDMTYHRTATGEILGYGTIVIESAGQQQAIRDLTFIPEPDDISAALNSEIFGERPRTKGSGTKERAWRRITPPRRRRDGGDDDDPGGGPPRGRGPGPRDNGPSGVDGGVDVSPAGHPPPPRSRPETWYRSSNLGAPRRLGDTGEIPVVHAAEADRSFADRPREDRARGVGRGERRERLRSRHGGDAQTTGRDSGGDAERWLAERRAEERARADESRAADPFARWGYSARHGQGETDLESGAAQDDRAATGAGERDPSPRGGEDDGHDPQAVREIPLYPPRHWIDPD